MTFNIIYIYIYIYIYMCVCVCVDVYFINSSSIMSIYELYINEIITITKVTLLTIFLI